MRPKVKNKMASQQMILKNYYKKMSTIKTKEQGLELIKERIKDFS